MAGDFWTVYTDYYDGRQFRPLRLFWIPLCELPLVRSHETVALYKLISGWLQIVFALRAVQQPSTIAISLASLHLMKDSSDSFMSHVQTLLSETENLSDKLLDLRKHFESVNITNKIVDGTNPFPENQQLIRDGISLEFRYFWLSLQFPPGVNVNGTCSGMCRSNILEVKSMLCAIYPLESIRASFA
jgi:hypothetical protein